jgi:hypothetical protein
MDAQENKWAIAMQKEKIKLKNTNKSSDDEQKELDKELDKTKELLIIATEKKDFDAIAKQYNKTVDLLAKQTALLLLALQEKYGTVSEVVVRNQAKQYQQDCLDIANAVDSLLINQE